jgi:hypothetical protein
MWIIIAVLAGLLIDYLEWSVEYDRKMEEARQLAQRKKAEARGENGAPNRVSCAGEVVTMPQRRAAAVKSPPTERGHGGPAC